ncbi:MAG: cation:proton antiporter, partial [Leifsonia sp.]|nr:cation:proton antiporter [Leifsonia sp.]
RDVFGAFFFLNFGLALDPSTFGAVLVPVIGAIVMTLVLNTAGGQLIAWLNKLTPAEGFNVSAMLQNRGEFALILATLAGAAGLDSRLTPFAGLYVLIMAIVGPVLAVNSERAGDWVFTRRLGRRRAVAVGTGDSVAARDREFALAEAAMAGDGDDELAALDVAASDGVSLDAVDGTGTFLGGEHEGRLLEAGADPDANAEDDDAASDAESRIASQASQQSDHDDARSAAARERDPEY